MHFRESVWRIFFSIFIFLLGKRLEGGPEMQRQVYFGAALFVQVNLIVLTFICRDALFVHNFGREHRAEYSAGAILLSSVVSTPAFTLASKMTRSLGPSNVGAVVAMLCSGRPKACDLHDHLRFVGVRAARV